jgi:glycosyltransferase involved in cell wall biosynthesis
MKVATPVITSHTPSLAEVSGGRALLVNPLSVSEISDAMLKITQQAPLRQKLVRAGLVWSRQFSWTKTARQTLAIYQSLC